MTVFHRISFDLLPTICAFVGDPCVTNRVNRALRAAWTDACSILIADSYRPSPFFGRMVDTEHPETNPKKFIKQVFQQYAYLRTFRDSPVDFVHFARIRERSVVVFSRMICQSIPGAPRDLFRYVNFRVITDQDLCRLGDTARRYLERLPSSAKEGLTHVTINTLRGLYEIPEEILCFPYLRTFDVSSCPDLVSLSPCLAWLPRLTFLGVGGTRLERLPREIGDMNALQVLNLAGSSFLRCLPQEICRLTSLVCLQIIECTQLEYIPEGVFRLPGLKIYGAGTPAMAARVRQEEDFPSQTTLPSDRFTSVIPRSREAFAEDVDAESDSCCCTIS